MKIKEVTPSLNTCQEIPDGYFTDSLFAWIKSRRKYVIIPGKLLTGIEDVHPAPILEEIMPDIQRNVTSMSKTNGKAHISILFCAGIDKTEYQSFSGPTLADAALSAWIYLHLTGCDTTAIDNAQDKE